MKNLKSLTMPSILLAVAVLAAGCHKTDNTDTNGMGPAQTAGKAVDDAGANAAQATREGAERTEAAAQQAGDNARDAAHRAGDNMSEAASQADADAHAAGAEARADAHAAGQDIKQGVSNATDATGKALEHAGQKVQDASK